MSDELSTESFIAGRYTAPCFTNLLPGQFAPPPSCAPLAVLAGNPLTLIVPAPVGGGNLSLEVYARGDVDRTNLIVDETPFPLSSSSATVTAILGATGPGGTGTQALTFTVVRAAVDGDVAWTLSGAFTAALPSDTWPFAFVQSTGSGPDTVTTVVSTGSFDVLATGF